MHTIGHVLLVTWRAIGKEGIDTAYSRELDTGIVGNNVTP